MTRDHALRLTLASTFFALGLVALGSAFVPIHWQAKDVLMVFGCLALAVSAVLDRTKVTATFWGRAPSGRVKVLKGFFAVFATLALIPAIIGLAFFFQQEPLGDGQRTYPGSILALFALHPFSCAYLTLAARGRSTKRRGRRVGP